MAKRLRRMVVVVRRGEQGVRAAVPAGELEVELTPQGTLAERMRAGGSGIPAFFTATGGGTQVAEGGLPWRYDADGNVVVASPPKETRDFEINGGPRSSCWRRRSSPTSGWCGPGRATGTATSSTATPRATSTRWPRCAGGSTIAEVEELVEPGELDPNDVHTPGVFVQRVVALTPEQAADKRIEKRTVRPRGGEVAQMSVDA